MSSRQKRIREARQRAWYDDFVCLREGGLPRKFADPEPPAQRHSPTSVSAAEAIVSTAATLRMRVYEAIVNAGAHGLTDEEIQHDLSMAGNTERPRRRELQSMGLIYDSGMTRKTVSGRDAVIWFAKVRSVEEIRDDRLTGS